MTAYAQLDRPVLLKYLFHPRKDYRPCPRGAFDMMVPVGEGVSVGCRFYPREDTSPWVLYFHGNGEVVSDYDELAPLYHHAGLNLVVADYRGYGASGGTPTFQDLVKDSRVIFEEVQGQLERKGSPRTLWVMGRSLGSIPALELAFCYPEETRGVIIESGFISGARLVKRLGLPPMGADLGSLEQECLAKVGKISIPGLVIHGQYDTLVPLQEGRDLFESLGSSPKELVVIPGADHNNIMLVDVKMYFGSLVKFIAPPGEGAMR